MSSSLTIPKVEYINRLPILVRQHVAYDSPPPCPSCMSHCTNCRNCPNCPNCLKDTSLSIMKLRRQRCTSYSEQIRDINRVQYNLQLNVNDLARPFIVWTPIV